jgi:hypothetical protein
VTPEGDAGGVGIFGSRPFCVPEKSVVSKRTGTHVLSTDNGVCLAWLAGALQQVRHEGQTKVVGYLESVLEEVVFEMKNDFSVVTYRTEGV